MVALNGFEIYSIAFVVVAAVVVVGLLLYLLRRLKNRRAKLLDDLDHRPQLSQDRAFNRLAMARRESDVLFGQGVDVRHANELIAQSQGAFDTRQFDRSYELAQSAHEALVNARRQGALTTSPPLTSSSGVRPAPGPLPATPVAGVAAAPALAAEPQPSRPTIPKNRAESQFQIRLLSDELEALPSRRAKDPNVVQANALKSQASQSFEKGEYTEAFRLALRGRRALGGNLEALPPTGSSVARPAAGAGNGAAAPSDLTRTVETVAGGERCSECGYPMLPGDAFCRGCGRPRGTMTCPTCGAPRGEQEPFCGRCGTRFP
ncbi:MAG TPA: zinc ribbon domain-containing protein [Thermoplasmata archaeon]|nr:zinc ribbon domain-containing protein [Thermoplasmata archaeon]